MTSPSRALTEAGSSAALIVLGSRGYGRVANALLGSVAFNVASRAACPGSWSRTKYSTVRWGRRITWWVTTRVEDCPAEVTLLHASEDAGLVVVGTRGRGGCEGRLLGSVSHAGIHGADCAVAVV